MRFPITKPLLACLAVVAVWFSPWWLGGKNLAPLDITHEMMEPWREGNTGITATNHIVSDSVTQYLIYRMIAAEDYRREGWVGWSSLTYGGTAQHANTMALYGDWTMQLHRVFDFWTAWHLGLMGQVMLAACGMLLWLRGRGVAAGWAVCGALIFACNSQFVTWINHRWALGAFCWVPWILWSIDAHRNAQAAGETCRPKWLSQFPAWLAPGFIALAFLGGTLQHMVLVVLAVMALWLEQSIKTGIKDIRRQLSLLFRFATWGVIGLALAAPVWLPAADAFLTTDKLGIHTGLHGRHDGIYPAGPLQPLFNLAAYPGQVFPSIFGRSDSLDLLKLFKSELFYVIYFGSLPVLIGFLAAWSKRAPLAARILVIAGLLLPLTPLVRPLYQRLHLLFIIGGILAFAHWMRHADETSKRRLLRGCAWLTSTAAACWLAASAAMQWKRAWLDETIHTRIANMGEGGSFGFFSDWMHGRVDHFINDLFIWSPHHLLPLLLWILILVGLRISLPARVEMTSGAQDTRAPWLGRLAHSLRTKAKPALKPLTALRPETRIKTGHAIIGTAVVLEVMLFASKWIVWTDPAKYPLFPETTESRLLRDHVGRDGRTTTLIHPTHHMARTPFVTNTLAAYGIPSILGYDSIVPDGINLVAMTTAAPEAMGEIGVSHLITWPENPEVPDGWIEVAATPAMTLYENPYRVPRYAGIVGDAEPWISLRETSGLENRRSIEIPAGLAAVRIAENHGSGWQYRTEKGGGWHAVQRADDGAMVIPLATSSATILDLRYRPPLRRAGFAIAGIAALMWIGSAVWRRPR